MFEAYGLMVKGAFGSLFAFTEMLTRATPLILTGLAAAVAFRAKLWNIGAEGQLYVGALAAVAVGTGAFTAPAFILIPLVVIAGALAGGLLMLGPTLLKTRLGVDEVVTTLLLNFIVLLFVQMMLEGPMQDPMAWAGRSRSRSSMKPPCPSCSSACAYTGALFLRWRRRLASISF